MLRLKVRAVTCRRVGRYVPIVLYQWYTDGQEHLHHIVPKILVIQREKTVHCWFLFRSEGCLEA